MHLPARFHSLAVPSREAVKILSPDFEKIAREYAPCDLGLPNVDLGIPDDRVKFAMDLCAELSETHGG